jgi:hypothetical protein
MPAPYASGARETRDTDSPWRAMTLVRVPVRSRTVF